MRKALLGALVALLVGLPIAAQEAPEASSGEQAPIVATGVGSLQADGAAAPLPWIATTQGALVALAPIAEALSAQLVVGPLGDSYNLVVGDSTFILAPGSGAVTLGTEILPLSQPPQVADGAIFVPIDLLEKTLGDRFGVQIAWDPAGHRLQARRPPSRRLPVELSIVHLQGVSTVVFRFPQAPRFRIEERSGGWDVVALGDRFVVPEPRAIDDPFVKGVSVDENRIRLDVAPGIAADHYRLTSPDRIVFDLFRGETPALGVASPTAPPPPAAARPLGGIQTIVIDPGHGGAETGAIGPAGTMEKELTLLIARTLAERLRSQLGVRVTLTRDDDSDLDLDERSAIANQNKADLFLSIHLNSTTRGDAHGAETYFLSLKASDERAADAAALENLVGQQAAPPGSDDFDLQLMLWDLAQSRHLAASQRLATFIQQELNRQLDLRDRGVKQAPFRVLMGAAMPAVLVELGFVSSPDDEARLRDPAYRLELVDTLVRAIQRFKTEYEASPGASGARP